MTEEEVAEVRELIHDELTAREIVAGPVDDFVMAKLRAAVNTVTAPDRLTAAVIATGIGIDSVTAMHLGDALSVYLRRIAAPLLQ